MAWLPIAQTVPQYQDGAGDNASGYVLKFYAAGTSTNILVSTDNTGTVQVTDVPLNANGNPEISGTTIIPHVDQSYKIVLYPSQAAADSDNGATWTFDNLTAPVTSVSLVQEKVKVSDNDTTEGFLYDKTSAGTGIVLAEALDGGNETLQISTIPSTFIDLIYPVGSIYVATVSTNPNLLFGTGTWTRIAEGRTLVGEGTGSGLTARTAGAEGGLEDSVVVTHQHPAVGNHTHSVGSSTDGTGTASSKSGGAVNVGFTSGSAGAHQHDAPVGASDGVDTNMPPYLVVYIWERTA